MPLQFVKAQRKKAKLRLAIAGPSGSGKTFGALMLAQGISGKIAVIDTERGSASLYSHMGDFDTLDLSQPFSPERYIEAIRAGAEHVGPDGVVIVDSLSHEWVGPGGCLEINEVVAKTQTHGNTWAAWAITGARHQKLLDTILNVDCHLIATLRSKTETAQVEEKGRKKVVKLGMKNETRDGAEYEFTVVLDLIHDGHYATASKDRTGLFTDKDPTPITKQTGERLHAWLDSGAAAKAEPTAMHIQHPPTEANPPVPVVNENGPRVSATEPDAPITDDSLELIGLDLGDADDIEAVRQLERRRLMLKRTQPQLDGAELESLRQAIQKKASSMKEVA